MDNLPTFFSRDFLNGGPLRELTRMQRQIDRAFNDSPGVFFSPSAEVEETEKAYRINFDLPGVKQSEVKVEVRDNVLTVSGERRGDMRSPQFRSEILYGSFERSFTLPSSVKAEQISAEFLNGVLSVTVPKAEAPKSRQISIGKSGAAEKAA